MLEGWVEEINNYCILNKPADSDSKLVLFIFFKGCCFRVHNDTTEKKINLMSLLIF